MSILKPMGRGLPAAPPPMGGPMAGLSGPVRGVGGPAPGVSLYGCLKCQIFFANSLSCR
jgi:hypothetical protein